MKQKVAQRNVLQIIIILFAFIMLIAFSIFPSTAAWNLYLPLINRLWPGEPGSRSPLLITEVMYDPINHEPGNEWIELYNRSFESISLVNYKIGDSETSGDAEGMFSFPPGGVIDPGQVIIIANQAFQFTQLFGFMPDFEFSDSQKSVPDMVKDKTWASGNVNLNNSGDEILLLDEEDSLLDVISWGNSTYAFYPPIPLVDEGHSVERKPADYDGNQAADWKEQSEPQPGKVDLVPPTPLPSATHTATLPPTTSPPIPVLVLNEIHADPHQDLGDANSDGVVDQEDDEFIEIVNNSSDPINLSAWTLGDLVKIRHTFPSGSILQPGCGVVIFGGGNPVGSFGNILIQLASSGKLRLDNQGEYVYVYDPSSVEVISYYFGPEGAYKQSITRDPDITGKEPLVKHSMASGSNGSLFSPGTKIDGSSFVGCSE